MEQTLPLKTPPPKTMPLKTRPLERIRKLTVAAIADYSMLAAHDRVLVAVSGGKDSAVMLVVLEEIRRKAPFPFTITAVMLDQKQPGFDANAFREWIKARDIAFELIEEDTYSIVLDKVEEGKAYCGLCSRLRRGILYNYAAEHKYTKIALGHHRDDLNQTILMNLFYGGRIASMPPKLRSDDGRNVVIRPLCYVPEAMLTTAAQELAVPIIPCNLCGSQENMQRKKIKQLLKNLEAEHPGIGHTMLGALKNVETSQLLDKALQNFADL